MEAQGWRGAARGPGGAGDARGGSGAPAAVPCPGARSGRSWPPSSRRLRPRPARDTWAPLIGGAGGSAAPLAPRGTLGNAVRHACRPYDVEKVFASWNHRTWVGSHLRTHPAPPPAMGSGTFH